MMDKYFPCPSLRGLLIGRRMLGVDENATIICVEGKSDAIAYRKFVGDNKKIFAVNELSRAKIDNNRDEVELYSKQYPGDYFIIDDDQRSIYIDDYQKKIPKNLATTFEFNDLEIWCFTALYCINSFNKLDLDKDDIMASLELAKKQGIIRLIQNIKINLENDPRWILMYRNIPKQIFELQPLIDINFNILDFIYENHQSVVETNFPDRIIRRKNMPTLKEWHVEIAKEEIKSKRAPDLKYIIGHDLTLYLYCVKATRDNETMSMDKWLSFEKKFREVAIKEGVWKDFLDTKMGRFLI